MKEETKQLLRAFIAVLIAAIVSTAMLVKAWPESILFIWIGTVMIMLWTLTIVIFRDLRKSLKVVNNP